MLQYLNVTPLDVRQLSGICLHFKTPFSFVMVLQSFHTYGSPMNENTIVASTELYRCSYLSMHPLILSSFVIFVNIKMHCFRLKSSGVFYAVHFIKLPFENKIK